MKYRVHNDNSISTMPRFIFNTYFKTMKEAKAYAEEIGNNPVIERKIGGEWYKI